ncbi:hypothetical protein QLS71_014170 [Mariniflexile litorale]|uniref:YD repeat-containing protein n=1 Tax=Mariniflexile litorale TaxID=3045158 RepID=A0AAU7EEC5_9FLAO|nr:hypothetical protein [Mariniflexile sp. KMM 9835]MDQ8212930.1 hypothetical protein [Mariniflexile sp. KMM 9835]
MKNLRILLIITIVILASCSRNDNLSDKNIRLNMYSVGDNDYELTYNSNNQLTGFETNTRSNSVIYNADNQIIQTGAYRYTYNELGKLSKIEEDGNQAELIYNTQGLLATMNFRFISGSTRNVTRTYKYDTNNKLIEIEEKGNTDSYKTRVLLTYDVNDNIVQVINQTSADLITYIDRNVISYTYDNKKNPYKLMLEKAGINNPITYYFFYPFETMYFGNYVFFVTFYFSENNLLTITNTYSSGISTTQYSYSYNERNYPISGEKITKNSLGETQTTYYNWTYETY